MSRGVGVGGGASVRSERRPKKALRLRAGPVFGGCGVDLWCRQQGDLVGECKDAGHVPSRPRRIGEVWRLGNAYISSPLHPRTGVTFRLDLLHPVGLDPALEGRTPVDVRLEEEEEGGAVGAFRLGVPVIRLVGWMDGWLVVGGGLGRGRGQAGDGTDNGDGNTYSEMTAMMLLRYMTLEQLRWCVMEGKA